MTVEEVERHFAPRSAAAQEAIAAAIRRIAVVAQAGDGQRLLRLKLSTFIAYSLSEDVD